MPAEIALTADGRPMMAYQGETPWHKLGTAMTDQKMDVVAALAAASLDWEVQLKRMFYRHGDRSINVPSRRAVVRNTDGQLLATVGSDYVPLQNTEAFSVLQPACEKFGVTIETAGALGKGDRVWMLAKLRDIIEPVPGDKVEGYLLVLTGHNGWTSYSARLTPTRVVCANTLQLAMADKAFVKLRHVKTASEQLDQVSSLITNMVHTLKVTGESFAKLAARQMTADEIRLYVEEVLGIAGQTDVNAVAGRRRDVILEMATKTGKGVDFAPATAWAAFNAVTEYVDHVRPAEAKNVRTIKQANESALFGTNAKVKAKALVLARKLAA